MAGTLISGAAALLFGGSYLGMRLMRPKVTRLREDMTGHLVELPQGRAHVQWHGDKDGPVLVCVHGLSTPSFVWGPLLPYLTGMGYRVLTFDLFGRGYSDRVRGFQDTAFFLRQLSDLLEAEGVSGRFTLMGYSMGGAIASAYAATYPEDVARLILLAPAGLGTSLGRFSGFVARTPILGDWLMEVVGARLLRASYGAGDGADPVADAITNRALDELSVAGTLRAILSAQRGILAENQSDIHRTLFQFALPVLAIWGEQDTTIPLSCRDRMAGLNPSATMVTLQEADHRLTYTHPKAVASRIGSPA